MKQLEIFSKREQRILKTLGRQKLSITELRERMTKNINSFHPDVLLDNNILAFSVRRINRKCEFHKLPWFLNGAGTGRQGKTIWKDKQ